MKISNERFGLTLVLIPLLCSVMEIFSHDRTEILYILMSMVVWAIVAFICVAGILVYTYSYSLTTDKIFDELLLGKPHAYKFIEKYSTNGYTFPHKKIKFAIITYLVGVAVILSIAFVATENWLAMFTIFISMAMIQTGFSRALYVYAAVIKIASMEKKRRG